MTVYEVLKRANDQEWEQVGAVEASSGESAVRALVRTLGLDAGDYRAVPARSFENITVTVEQTEPKITVRREKVER